MQLRRKRSGKVRRRLGLLTATLFAATGLHSQALAQSTGDVNDDAASDLGMTRIDSAVLFYRRPVVG